MVVVHEKQQSTTDLVNIYPTTGYTTVHKGYTVGYQLCTGLLQTHEVGVNDEEDTGPTATGATW